MPTDSRHTRDAQASACCTGGGTWFLPDAPELLLDEIAALELEMFLSIRPATPAACQEQPDTYALWRRATYAPLSRDTLRSYLTDLLSAAEEGRNLIAEKYARMDDLRPRTNWSPHIAVIVQAVLGWMERLATEYPSTFQDKSTEYTARYLASELETMSERTLELYAADVARATTENRNLPAETYAYAARQLGAGSLEQIERGASRAAPA